jgi:hypothetical protein
MRSDLQAMLSAPIGSSTYPMSTGQLADDKQAVLTFLYLRWLAGNVTLNEVNAANKAAGMQGVTADNMIDLQIQGLANFQGFGGFGWPALVNAARTAINGQGVSVGGITKWLFPGGTQGDYADLLNYALLTGTHILNDAS